MIVDGSWVVPLYRSSRIVFLQVVLSVCLLIARTAKIVNFHCDSASNTPARAAVFQPSLSAIALAVTR